MKFNYNSCAFKSYEDAQRYYDSLSNQYDLYLHCAEHYLEILKDSCSIEDLTDYQYFHDMSIVFKGLMDDFYERVLKHCRKDLMIQMYVEREIKKYLGKKDYERYMKNYVASKTSGIS